MRNQPGASALNWLALDTTGASLIATAQTLMEAEQVVRKALPPVLAHTCRVANMDRQSLTLAVPAAAHATRLRQLQPTIMNALAKHGWNLNRIEFPDHADPISTASRHPPRVVQPLGRKALYCFESLQQKVVPGPLADAINRLLAHHGR